MRLIKKVLAQLENFAKEKPFLFWLTTSLLTFLLGLIPLSQWTLIKPYLIQYIEIPIYLFVVILVLMMLLSILFYLIGRKAFARSYGENLIRLEALLKQLNSPFEIEESNFPAKGMSIRKFFPYEILGCFSEINEIITDLKEKYPDKFKGVTRLNNIPHTPINDWVPESEVQNMKSMVIKLISLLK